METLYQTESERQEEAPEDPVALGIVKEQAYLWQMLLSEARGDTA